MLYVVFDALHRVCCPAFRVQPLIRACASLVSCHHFSMLSVVSDMNLVLTLRLLMSYIYIYIGH